MPKTANNLIVITIIAVLSLVMAAVWQINTLNQETQRNLAIYNNNQENLIYVNREKTEKIETPETDMVENSAEEKIPKEKEEEENYRKTEYSNNPPPQQPKQEVAVKAPPIIETIYTIISPDWEKINEISREATVNIICVSPSGGLVNPISGSGVLISDKGVILTNAHIAQYFLLDKYNGRDFIECSIRKGSPASPAYKADLLFISPAWIAEHGEEINKQNATGTGEYDYALLLVSGPVGPSITLPDKFPYLIPNTEPNTEYIGSPVLINAYPAGFLGGATIQTSLYLISATSNIKEVFTFASTSVDLISLGGNVDAQKGASGGGVTNPNGALAGIIVTSSEASQTSERDLRAITLSYINNVLGKELGVGLNELLSSDLPAVAKEFSEKLKPELQKFLIGVLEKAIN